MPGERKSAIEFKKLMRAGLTRWTLLSGLLKGLGKGGDGEGSVRRKETAGT